MSTFSKVDLDCSQRRLSQAKTDHEGFRDLSMHVTCSSFRMNISSAERSAVMQGCVCPMEDQGLLPCCQQCSSWHHRVPFRLQVVAYSLTKKNKFARPSWNDLCQIAHGPNTRVSEHEQ